MLEVALLAATALALGAMHSFAPDHLAAVSVFVSRRPGWRRAVGLGARWGVGHSLVILALGGALALSGARLPDPVAAIAERVVGVTLVGLGVVALWRARRLHGHWHTHDGVRHWHVHSHAGGASHEHGHGALVGIGMLHGLAGTGALVVALPAATAASPSRALLFLISFGVGTVMAMALFGAAAGWLMDSASRRSRVAHRVAVVSAGAMSIGVGGWWLS